MSPNTDTPMARLAAAVRPDMTAEQAAKACHTVICAAAKADHQNPDVEVFIRAPGEPRHYADQTCWCVCWEAGPDNWAVAASMAISRTARLVEPWYGFDLSFYPAEWAAKPVRSPRRKFGRAIGDTSEKA